MRVTTFRSAVRCRYGSACPCAWAPEAPPGSPPLQLSNARMAARTKPGNIPAASTASVLGGSCIKVTNKSRAGCTGSQGGKGATPPVLPALAASAHSRARSPEGHAAAIATSAKAGRLRSEAAAEIARCRAAARWARPSTGKLLLEAWAGDVEVEGSAFSFDDPSTVACSSADRATVARSSADPSAIARSTPNPLAVARFSAD
mmetsp:Transcript_8694/g.21770  ORF Transcript_8694/g.21770 Transcript_8694/m.21770 type:complete len:203 (+) Transcript_8694:1306-1914(+)